jgi:hypothetical protein
VNTRACIQTCSVAIHAHKLLYMAENMHEPSIRAVLNAYEALVRTHVYICVSQLCVR